MCVRTPSRTLLPVRMVGHGCLQHGEQVWSPGWGPPHQPSRGVKAFLRELLTARSTPSTTLQVKVTAFEKPQQGPGCVWDQGSHTLCEGSWPRSMQVPLPCKQAGAVGKHSSVVCWGFSNPVKVSQIVSTLPRPLSRHPRGWE